MSNTDIEFIDGLIVKPPRAGVPDFVKMEISIKRADLGNYLRGKDEDWLNIDVKESKNGKWYAALNTWKPDNNKPSPSQPSNNAPPAPIDDGLDSDIPF